MTNTDTTQKEIEELKIKIKAIRKEARITFIESPYGYIDNTFFENKVWKEIEDTIGKALSSQRQRALEEVREKAMSLRIGNIGKPPYNSVDREYLQYNQALSDLTKIIGEDKV